ncbi:Universal stress protein A family protein C25B2.10 [Fusarium oxysporum f. sp. albedinis]|nr:Universal stress protein A family protein C25B2.10 [Fusarium oxysporum f. sp. albedinis]
MCVTPDRQQLGLQTVAWRHASDLTTVSHYNLRNHLSRNMAPSAFEDNPYKGKGLLEVLLFFVPHLRNSCHTIAGIIAPVLPG